jgi:hypothetical protein
MCQLQIVFVCLASDGGWDALDGVTPSRPGESGPNGHFKYAERFRQVTDPEWHRIRSAS